MFLALAIFRRALLLILLLLIISFGCDAWCHMPITLFESVECMFCMLLFKHPSRQMMVVVHITHIHSAGMLFDCVLLNPCIGIEMCHINMCVSAWRTNSLRSTSSLTQFGSSVCWQWTVRRKLSHTHAWYLGQFHVWHACESFREYQKFVSHPFAKNGIWKCREASLIIIFNFAGLWISP